MAVYLSGKEVCKRIAAIIADLTALHDSRLAIDQYAEALEREGQTAATIQTAINARLVDWGASRDEIATFLSALPILHQPRVKVGMPANYINALVDASTAGHSGYGIIVPDLTRLTYVSPFTCFQAGDDVIISNAAKPANDSTFRVSIAPVAAGGNVLVNTDFASNWTAANWTVSGGFADHNTGNTSALAQAGSVMSGLVDNQYYICLFTVTDWTAGSFTVKFDTSGPVQSFTAIANETYAAIVYSDSAGSLLFTPTSTFDGKISAPVLVPFTGLAFTGALNADSDADTTLVITLAER